jgi:PAP2 superfamily
LLTVQAPGLTRLQSQLRLVIDCADERPDRLAEILVQARSLWPFWSAITNVVPGQTPRSAELMAVVQAVTSHLGHAFKQSLAVPRPVDLSALVQPCITTPGHGSLPSGHAMAAFVAVRLLRDLLPSSIAGGGIDTVGIALDRTARRIAANRVVAGLHYPIDNSAGWCVAESAFDTLRMLADRATAVPGHRAFDADGTTIEELPAADAPLTDAAVGSTLTPQAGNPPTSSSPLLKILWDAADEELTRLQLN